MNTEFLDTETCKRMMEEQKPWFDFNFRAAKLRLEQTGTAGARYRHISGFFHYDVPLPLHVAWVLARAEEEMGDRVHISVNTRGSWFVTIKRTGEIEGSYHSRPAAVLAAYEYLYPASTCHCDPGEPDSVSVIVGGGGTFKTPMDLMQERMGQMEVRQKVMMGNIGSIFKFHKRVAQSWKDRRKDGE